MDSEHLLALVTAHFDDEITSAEQAELETALLQDATACELFWQQAQFENLLLVAGQRREPSRPTQQEVSLPQRAWTTIYDFASNYITLSLLIASLVIAIIVLSMGLIVPDWGQGGPGEGPNLTEFVAELSDTSEVTWDKVSDINFHNRSMFVGDKLVLKSGLAEMVYDNGVRVILEGPAEYEVRGANGGQLHWGKLVARIESESAKGFFVETPHARVVDLGTAFGIEVSKDGAAEVAVLAGKVDVLAAATDARPAQAVRLVEHQGASITVAGEIEKREAFHVGEVRERFALRLPPVATLSDGLVPYDANNRVFRASQGLNNDGSWRFVATGDAQFDFESQSGRVLLADRTRGGRLSIHHPLVGKSILSPVRKWTFAAHMNFISGSGLPAVFGIRDDGNSGANEHRQITFAFTNEGDLVYMDAQLQPHGEPIYLVGRDGPDLRNALRTYRIDKEFSGGRAEVLLRIDGKLIDRRPLDAMPRNKSARVGYGSFSSTPGTSEVEIEWMGLFRTERN